MPGLSLVQAFLVCELIQWQPDSFVEQHSGEVFLRICSEQFVLADLE